MRFSDIKIKHIYNVIFDPVKDCEFNGKHLALVLKRNNDNRTYIVMPLTSESNGNGVNKIKLGKIQSLPSSLRTHDTYAVFNQIRTVNASRFIALKEGSNVIKSKTDDEIFTDLLGLGINELLFNLEQDEKIELLKKVYEQQCVIKAKDLAYNILSLNKQIEAREEKIVSIKQEIKEILNNIPYTLEQKHIDDGIKDILDDILKDN
ncbi:MAG: type II toxin-antitoxin system PemK/MazF family toxin [Tepidibacter sp.]|jgi:mRNA-degrading endonuclease toxin of MazEF toxin-antitoxin module|uniref:type II toxin-antitoxin system PemK/MazF family toxin n=1 Tax=Tepidibacter sp. TaxID=2529387 RepID=UPI0025D681CD|nr:type II toxin-antitoxin system PemK/MazF family toxin [Tepidibacter sp.]MCT4507344.1 type II toxin-antitoxin system PemK/MazF family toxin [Tepidibacter sp.]